MWVRRLPGIVSVVLVATACAGRHGDQRAIDARRTNPPVAAPSDDLATVDSAMVETYFAEQTEEKRHTDARFVAALGREMLVRKIAYAGAGDVTIPAYLFAPRDTTVRRPTVLFVHGGVHADFDLTHLAQVRALVRRGWVVVAPDYRGSTGYGARLYAAIDYGGLEVDDVVAARGYLARFAPYADLDRLAIMGYSHGGYIALLAVLRHPEHFRAAVAHVPVADLPTRMRTHPSSYEALFVAQPAFGAPLAERPAPYVARSPSAHARELTRPVLVHAADNDEDVHIVENHILRDSMRAAGMDARGLYTYREWHDPPGGHAFGVLDTPQGRDSWRETLAFLDRHVAHATRDAAAGDSASVTLRAARTLDGHGAVLRDALITVRGGRIVAVDTTAASRRTRATYDLGDRTLLPGFIDAHVHLGWYFDARGALRTRSDGEDSVAFRAIAANARATLLAGVTTVQSVGGPEDAAVRDAIARGAIPGPRVLTSLAPISDTSRTPDELRAVVREHRRDGADLIKLFASAGLGAGGERTLSDAQLAAICGEAATLGLRTVVHAISAASVAAATRAGCTEIEHGLYATDAERRAMAERGTIFGPQMCLVFRNYLDRRADYARAGFAPSAFETLANALPTARDAFRRALATPGLRIVFSTDAVAGAHGRNLDELVCRVREGGQPPMDAIVSATSGAARALGLTDVGTVAPGFAADLVVLDGDPLRDIRVVRRVAFVMRAGVVHARPSR